MNVKKHPVFDLWLHDDEELKIIAGKRDGSE